MSAYLSSACPFHRFVAMSALGGVTVLAARGLQSFAKAARSKCRWAPALTAQAGVDPFIAERMVLATKLALEAGHAMRLIIDHEKVIENKAANDLVTETDKQNEKLIFNGLREKFPSDKFIGEESSAAAGSIDALTNDPTWIVDPIDGTTNFVHGFPMTCVSIGFAHHGKCVAGVIYNPCSDEMYQAVRGHGTWLNGRRVYGSKATALEHSLVIYEFNTQRGEAAMERMMVTTKDVLRRTRGMRQVGSGCMDLALVGVGRVDAVFSGVAGFGWKPWDYAAGWVIAEEGGCVISQLDGSPFHLFSNSILCCATQELADELRETVRPK